MGVAPIISYNYGCRNDIRLKKVFHICIWFVIILSIVLFLFSMGFASPLIAVFSPKGTPVYEITRNGFLIFPFSFLFCGFNIFVSAAFTALSNGKLSAILSFLRTFGLILILLWLLPNWIGIFGVWLAVPAAEFITMIVAILFLSQKTASN